MLNYAPRSPHPPASQAPSPPRGRITPPAFSVAGEHSSSLQWFVRFCKPDAVPLRGTWDGTVKTVPYSGLCAFAGMGVNLQLPTGGDAEWHIAAFIHCPLSTVHCPLKKLRFANTSSVSFADSFPSRGSYKNGNNF